MKTRAEIYYNFVESLNKAAELEEIASKIKKMANANFSNNLESLKKSWTGDAANRYLAKGSNLKAQLLKEAASLNAAAGVIRSTAQRTYKTEMNNLEIARRRTYK